MKKFLSVAMLACAVSFAGAAVDAKPLRLGPVSAYGTLGAKSGKIVSQSTGKQVMLRGMSLFWSDATGSQYYNPIVINWAAEKLGIDVFRFAMGIDCYNSNGSGCQKDNIDGGAIASNVAYKYNPSGKEAQLDNMVKAAIENDIYIIVDWHSHRAENEKDIAKDFFGRMAKKYADVPNIIWEVYNEPVNTDMGTIAGYANEVIGAIRNNGSKHLALVGTPFYSQMGSCSGVNDENSGYVFHFYAASHSLNDFKGKIEGCLNNGKAVFITEWGTTEASGAGSVSTGGTNEWTAYMDQKSIPNCNWSLRHESIGGKNEASAMFAGSTLLNSKNALNNANYTTSGSLVKSYLTKHNNKSWADTLTAGKHSGSCSFKHQKVGEMDGDVSGVASGSCTYTSSDESVATVEAGTIKIKGAGYAVLTGNDNSQSVVEVTPVPEQTFTQGEVVCRLNGSGCANFTSSGSDLEYKLKESKTVEGAEVTYESDNPSVVTVSKTTCTSSECYGDKNKQVWIASFKGPGTANVHATAKAVAGYRAVDVTIPFSLLKNVQTLNTKYFKDQEVALGSSTQVFTLEAHKIPVTYTILPEGRAEQQGVNLVAGNTDATIMIKADVPENDQYESLTSYITVKIGAGNDMDLYEAATAFGLLGGPEYIAPQTKKNLASNAAIRNKQLVVNVKRAGFVKVQILDMNGRVARDVVRYMSVGTHELNLADMPQGMYMVTVKSGSAMNAIRWRNK